MNLPPTFADKQGKENIPTHDLENSRNNKMR